MTRNAKWPVVNASALLLGLSGFTGPSFADTVVGYKFSWVAVVAAWRYLDYQFSNHSSTLAMNGPAIGVGFRW
jgi:hypothetical protein